MKTLIAIKKGPIFDTFFTPENIELAESLGDVIWQNGDALDKETLKRLIADRDVYIALWGSPKLTEEIVSSAKNLKLVTVLGSTVSPFVSDAVWQRGIKVISAFDYFSESTAEGTVAYMLSALRRIPYYSERLKHDRIWGESIPKTDSLIYKTVGIVSYGGVGRHVVKKLQPFNVKIKVYDIVDIPESEKERYGFTQCSLEEIFSTCDIISLHTPYNEKTHHMIDERLFSMIKKGALLVNTARGGVIDQEALTRHLLNKDFYAALDVYEKEPLDESDALFNVEDILMLPHHGGVTVNLRSILTEALLLESAGFIDKDEPLKNEIKESYAKNMSAK